MYTEPIIVNPEKPGRPYISFYLNGIRQRIYSGRVLGLPIYPNKAKNPADRLSSLQTLRKALLSALETDTFPFLPLTISDSDQVQRLIKELVRLTADINRIVEQSAQCKAEIDQIKMLLADHLLRR